MPLGRRLVFRADAQSKGPPTLQPFALEEASIPIEAPPNEQSRIDDGTSPGTTAPRRSLRVELSLPMSSIEELIELSALHQKRLYESALEYKHDLIALQRSEKRIRKLAIIAFSSCVVLVTGLFLFAIWWISMPLVERPGYLAIPNAIHCYINLDIFIFGSFEF
jgi:hypothetical protein